jgi:hypothetical protein
MALRQGIILLVLATLIGFGFNFISPNGVSVISHYRDLTDSDGPIVPPETQAGDPPFIDANVAQLEHGTGKTLFVDARDPEEFECGTIPGLIRRWGSVRTTPL